MGGGSAGRMHRTSVRHSQINTQSHITHCPKVLDQGVVSNGPLPVSSEQ